MEHGRLTLECSELNRPQPFWLAGNTEGLRWHPEGHLNGPGEWSITIPLWILILACLWWRRRSRKQSERDS